MGVTVNTSQQQVTASVSEEKVEVGVSAGFGPTGPSGVTTVTAPITNAGTTTAANIGLSVGTGLQVAGGSLAVTYGGDSTSACVGNDARLSNARTPTAHAASHAADGADALTLTASQVIYEGQGPFLGPNQDVESALAAIESMVEGKAEGSHTHDDRYYTESEVNTLLAGKATPSDVSTAVANLVNSAPASLDTLKELSDALGADANFSTTVTNSLAAKAPINNPTFTGTVSGVTKGMVGLGNVDNTSDANKPVSSATQTALNGKAAASHASNHAAGGSDQLFDQSLNMGDSVTFNHVYLNGNLQIAGDALLGNAEIQFLNHIGPGEAYLFNPTITGLYGISFNEDVAANQTRVAIGAAAASHTHTQLHDRSHAITSTSDHTAGNWKTFYSNGSGQVLEVSIGSAGQTLVSNGATAAPTYQSVQKAITSGTAAPTGGSDGDIYLRYT